MEAFYKYLEFLARMVLGKAVTVRPVPGSDTAGAEENEELPLGYTSAEGVIFLAWMHPIMKGLSEKEREFLRLGVFAHELLHQLLTDFDALQETVQEGRSNKEREMIRTFANLIEDPAIEYFAPVPRLLQRALRFLTEWVFYCSPPLETWDAPLVQLLNALVMYGDTGKLKGKFTFPDAERYYREIIPEFMMEICDPDAAFRPVCARSWVELTRPLWEENEKLEEQLKGFLEKLAKSMASGTGEARISPSESGEETRGRIRRMEEGCVEDGMHGTEDSEGMKSRPEGDGKEGFPDVDKIDTGSGTKLPGGHGPGSGDSAREARTIVRRPTLTKDDTALLDSAEAVIRDTRKEMEPEKTKIPSHSKSAGGGDTVPFKVCNTAVMDEVSDSDRETYRILRERLAGTPDALARVLRELMRRHTGTTYHSSHGRLNVRRWAAGTSQNIFDRKVQDKDCGGTHIFLAIDLSGSMCSPGRIEAARDAAIIFAETCSKLKIPLMIMGYTAELNGRSLDHFHYVRTGSERERVSLAKIRAMGENADGYSFRYLEQEVRQSRAEKKIVLILTDGYPASPAFYGAGKRDGFKDTRDAFNRLKRSANILAFGLGTSEEQMKEIYGNSFVQVSDVAMLPQVAANRFKEFF